MIYKEAGKRADKIIGKYDKSKYEGCLDGEPWSKELRQDSKRVVRELEELDKEYHQE